VDRSLLRLSKGVRVADEDAIESADQGTDDAPQAEVVAPDESSDIVTADATSDEAVADQEPVEAGEPEAVEAAPVDVSTMTAAELTEANPELAKILRNAGSQAKEAEMHRESGSRERSAERLNSIRERLAAGEDITAELNFLDDNNLENARQRALSELTDRKSVV